MAGKNGSEMATMLQQSRSGAGKAMFGDLLTAAIVYRVDGTEGTDFVHAASKPPLASANAVLVCLC